MHRIAITTEGKLAAVDARVPEKLMRLLDEPEDVLLNVIKAITVVAEVPMARTSFAAITGKLRELMGMSGDRLDATAVSRNAERALAVITWKP